MSLLLISVSQNENMFSVFPNPSEGNIEIRFEHLVASASIQIYNLLGAVYSESLNNNQHSKQIHLDVPPGIYFIKIETGETIITKRLIIQ